MLVKIVKKILLDKTLIKIISLTIGYNLWLILANNIIITKELSIPISFYNKEGNVQIEAPESVYATICGAKTLLDDIEDLAFYIDLNKLQPGSNLLSLETDQLYMPGVNLIKYKPVPVEIKIFEINKLS